MPQSNKKTFTIHGVISEEGRLNAAYWAGVKGDDATDVGLLYDDFSGYQGKLAEVDIEVEIDFDAIFKTRTLKGAITRVKEINDE